MHSYGNQIDLSMDDDSDSELKDKKEPNKLPSLAYESNSIKGDSLKKLITEFSNFSQKRDSLK